MAWHWNLANIFWPFFLSIISWSGCDLILQSATHMSFWWIFVDQRESCHTHQWLWHHPHSNLSRWPSLEERQLLFLFVHGHQCNSETIGKSSFGTKSTSISTFSIFSTFSTWVSTINSSTIELLCVSYVPWMFQKALLCRIDALDLGLSKILDRIWLLLRTDIFAYHMVNWTHVHKNGLTFTKMSGHRLQLLAHCAEHINTLLLLTTRFLELQANPCVSHLREVDPSWFQFISPRAQKVNQRIVRTIESWICFKM